MNVKQVLVVEAHTPAQREWIKKAVEECKRFMLNAGVNPESETFGQLDQILERISPEDYTQTNKMAPAVGKGIFEGLSVLSVIGEITDFHVDKPVGELAIISKKHDVLQTDIGEQQPGFAMVSPYIKSEFMRVINASPLTWADRAALLTHCKLLDAIASGRIETGSENIAEVLYEMHERHLPIVQCVCSQEEQNNCNVHPDPTPVTEHKHSEEEEGFPTH